MPDGQPRLRFRFAPRSPRRHPARPEVAHSRLQLGVAHHSCTAVGSSFAGRSASPWFVASLRLKADAPYPLKCVGSTPDLRVVEWLLQHLIRADQDRLRYWHTERLGRLEVDD